MTSHMNWILIGVLALSTCCLATSAWLWYWLKRQAWEARREAKQSESGLLSSIAAVRADFNALNDRFDELEERTGMLVAPPPAISGLNLNRRTQALRMLARGEQPDRIAAALDLPLGETALLAKVRRLSG
jgi:hypothetical protein